MLKVLKVDFVFGLACRGGGFERERERERVEEIVRVVDRTGLRGLDAGRNAYGSANK